MDGKNRSEESGTSKQEGANKREAGKHWSEMDRKRPLGKKIFSNYISEDREGRRWMQRGRRRRRRMRSQTRSKLVKTLIMLLCH